uniref:RNA-binding protein n=1 Tax=Gongylonema pulchrum TaxID=637853 RepID=A0A183EMK5_9BILA
LKHSSHKSSLATQKEQTPPLIDFYLDDNPGVQEPSVLQQEKSPKITTATNSKKTAAVAAPKKKDWDDDAWELLNE